MEENNQMIAAEPAVAYTPTMFDTVISYLHSSHMPISTKRAVYRQLQREVADENMAYMKRRLKEFASLEAGWDGYGDAIPVSSIAISHAQQIINACRPSDLSEWRLFPNVNGTLLLELDNAAINIGDDFFTYWAESKGKDIGEEFVPFKVDDVVEAIRKINVYV